MFSGSCRHGKEIRDLWYHKALEGQVENVTFMMIHETNLIMHKKLLDAMNGDFQKLYHSSRFNQKKPHDFITFNNISLGEWTDN